MYQLSTSGTRASRHQNVCSIFRIYGQPSILARAVALSPGPGTMASLETTLGVATSLDAASVCASLIEPESEDQDKVNQTPAPPPKKPKLCDTINLVESLTATERDESPSTKRRSFSGPASAIVERKRGRKPSSAIKYCRCCKCLETDQDPVSLALSLSKAKEDLDPCEIL